MGHVTGKLLKPELVQIERREEIDCLHEMNVCTKVPVDERTKATGKQPVGVNWVDVSKHDEDNPRYRSRLVAKEAKRSPMHELYAATPPLERLRMSLSDVMTGGVRSESPTGLLVCDVSRA